MKRRFHTLDVFTDKRHEGNPLAVVLDSDGLTDNDMQAIAREFNLAETVFVFPPEDQLHAARIRIFTPGSELPFAGHPTVGTAVLLAELRAGEMLGGAGVTIVLEEKIGPVRVDVSRQPGRASRAVFALPALPKLLEHPFDPLVVAAAIGLDPAEIGFGAHGIAAWSAGVPFVMVPVRSLEAIGRAGMADPRAWAQAFGVTGKSAAFLYTRETVRPDHHVHARMFAPKMGIPEDPATGSAVAAFAGVAASCELPEDGVHQLVIEQGFEMGRPSLIALDLDILHGALVAAAIGGSAVRMSEGVLL
ncbi:MAG: PhzF family phenazine biosynthesis protein [Methylobacterium sp.]|nr:PhzF family phenazine biosynthesis protein [Methylobacterium sp.]MCA3606237.1 PhzF family phenazine biosynthesis protein [Methylobacterium sp.]MCA3609906.1 PhzF family phenazine biosynthesis protein [Methylobacterium sp.]MCA3616486.1 PhzF family phenazine biosynthesis protein [Methylobacterium sp.]MCA3620904.1 PhzF family phenazine biosynthesis protein [Methylobacterium sp.]